MFIMLANEKHGVVKLTSLKLENATCGLKVPRHGSGVLVKIATRPNRRIFLRDQSVQCSFQAYSQVIYHGFVSI